MELPVFWATYISVTLFVLQGCGVWSIPKSAVVPKEYAHARWRDLRWWATGLIFLQILLYAFFS